VGQRYATFARLKSCAFLSALVVSVLTAGAQEPSPSPAASPAPGSPTPGGSTDPKEVIEQQFKQEELVLSGKGGYNYDPAGRRDPFVDPLSAANQQDKEKSRPEGWPGMLIAEVQLQGITIYGGDPIAIFAGTDGVGYFAREGDELWDGKIISIDFDGGKVTLQQKVEDPSSPVRFRNVEKKLNP
jgi:hypothetical protein